jgi:hypothetical protein
MILPIPPLIPLTSRATSSITSSIDDAGSLSTDLLTDLRIAPSARFASLFAAILRTSTLHTSELAGLQASSSIKAAAVLAGKQLDWLQQKIAASHSPAPDRAREFEEFAVVIAGRSRVATVFIWPEMVQNCINNEVVTIGGDAVEGVSAAMRALLDCCGTKPGQQRSGEDLLRSLDCANALLKLLSPAEAAKLHLELEQCRELGHDTPRYAGCVVGLLGEDTLGKDTSSLWPLFMRLTALPNQHVETSKQISASRPSLTESSRIQPPRINVVGDEVPERHADRVVAEMLRWIVAEHQQRMAALKGILSSTPDANPQDQQRLADKFKRLGGPFFPAVGLMKSAKRGRYEIHILAIDGWNRDTQKLIFVRNEIPERPQLAASVLIAKGLGHHRHDLEMRVELIVSHHALSRLVQRSENRTVDDLLTAVTSMFTAFVAAGLKIDGENSRLRFQTNGGEVIAQLERHWDGSGKVVAKTILMECNQILRPQPQGLLPQCPSSQRPKSLSQPTQSQPQGLLRRSPWSLARLG